MTLKEKLLSESRNTIEDYSLLFACNIEPMLFKEAQNGKSEYLVDFDNDDKHIVTSDLFIKNVSELLDGVNVEVIQKPISAIFPSLKTSYLRLSWGDMND
ncbi:hypothetical protein [Lysinibacillus sp. RC79]|uniref:hypothetical protein n=1 Tax=Lysinibacillus sp. RC79 TaxID=3156296 RepID=UPI0035177442